MNLQKDVPLARFSTFRIGGRADFVAHAQTKKDIEAAITYAEEKKIPFLCIGGGSNILFSDKGFRGLILRIEKKTIEKQSDGTFTVGAGVMNIELYREAKKNGFDFSPFYTIPGTIGGAVMGNAGVPAGEIKDVFVSAEMFNRQEKTWETHDAKFFDFSYRHTIFHARPELRKKYILFSVTLSLPRERPEVIEKKATDFLTMRKEKQPWGKTGGSFFRNPPEGAAGYFLEKAGMKGTSCGDAFFSEKHANFMMNAGDATQKEIIELARLAKKTVWEKYKVELQPEVRVIDEWGEGIKI